MADRRSYNREYYANYYAKNGDKIRRQNRERSKLTGRKGLQSLDYRRMVISLLRQRDQNICGVCGNYVGEDASVDHIRQRAIGGGDNAENLRLTHLSCNRHREKPRGTNNG